MKKTLYFLFLVVTLILTACSSDSDKAENDKANSNEKSVEVDKGLINVEVTLPASMFEGEDMENVLQGAEDEGIKAKQNEDGSVTYKMSKSKHKEMMDELSKGIVETVEEMKNDDELTSIQDITYNKKYTEFTLVVDKEAYENSFDGFATLGLAMSGMYYQLFSGVDPEDYQVVIKVKDSTTNEIFSETVYPDALDEMDEEQES